MRFQLRFVRSSSTSYEYVDATPETAPTAAAAKANEWLAHQRELVAHRFYYRDHQEPRTVMVVEYENGRAKPKGLKFKLRLRFVEVQTVSGERRRDEWYEPHNQ